MSELTYKANHRATRTEEPSPDALADHLVWMAECVKFANDLGESAERCTVEWHENQKGGLTLTISDDGNADAAEEMERLAAAIEAESERLGIRKVGVE